MNYLIFGGLLLFLLMKSRSNTPQTSTSEELPPVADATETDSNGDIYWLIRPQGLPEPDGSFEVALYAKQGVDQNKTVFMKSLSGERFIAMPA